MITNIMIQHAHTVPYSRSLRLQPHMLVIYDSISILICPVQMKRGIPPINHTSSFKQLVKIGLEMLRLALRHVKSLEATANAKTTLWDLRGPLVLEAISYHASPHLSQIMALPMAEHFYLISQAAMVLT